MQKWSWYGMSDFFYRPTAQVSGREISSTSAPNPIEILVAIMVGEEVGTKLVRLLYFVGAGVICTKGINLYRDYERKAAIKAAEASQNSAEMANGAAAES